MDSSTKVASDLPLDSAELMPVSIDSLDPGAEASPYDVPVPSSLRLLIRGHFCVSNIADHPGGTRWNLIP